MRRLVLIWLLPGCWLNAFSQKPAIKSPADCADANLINVGKATVFYARVNPKGAGEKNEINGTATNRLFEEEHNTAWHVLNILVNGDLVFDIVPRDSTNDYDFALFHYTDEMDCMGIEKGMSLPLRSNLSRGMIGNKGMTGLNSDEKKTFVRPGPGNTYSSALPVKKGEKYLLVIDNVTPRGKPYSIRFSYIETIHINGVILDEDKKGVVAKVMLINKEGRKLAVTQSNTDGEYSIKSEAKSNEEYKVVYEKNGHFTQTIAVTGGNVNYQNMKTVLPKLKAGKNYTLDNIEFHGDSDQLLSKSISSAEALYELMKKNKSLVIQVEGHANNIPSLGKNNDDESLMALSGKRADAVRNFLIDRGIDSARMSTKAYGATRMLNTNPNAKDADLSINRRVEIMIISM